MTGRGLSKKHLNLLNSLANSPVILLDAFIEAGHAYDKRIYRAYAKSFYNLERYDYVEKKRDKKNQSFFHLTPKGRLSVLKYLHLEKLTRKWDGHWRIVIFDVPEQYRKWRERLRFKLLALGFQALQESVYITLYPVLDELDKLLKDRNLRRYFRYITVT